MEMSCEFKEITPEPERNFVIQFTLTLKTNACFDIEPLKNLFADQNLSYKLRNGEEMVFDSHIFGDYQRFFSLIKNFGYGIVIFPTIVKQLKGSYFFQHKTDASMEFKIGFKIPFQLAGGEKCDFSEYYINAPKQEVNGK
jgi:hypothetical protein